VKSRCVVVEGGVSRTFEVTVEPMGADPTAAPGAATPAATSGTPVFSAFAGTVEIVDIVVSVGDSVSDGQKVAAVEAMKAQHDIKAWCSGKVTAIHVSIGDEVDSSKPIMTIA
jgi:biotin carboxyl carrier protein